MEYHVLVARGLSELEGLVATLNDMAKDEWRVISTAVIDGAVVWTLQRADQGEFLIPGEVRYMKDGACVVERRP